MRKGKTKRALKNQNLSHGLCYVEQGLKRPKLQGVSGLCPGGQKQHWLLLLSPRDIIHTHQRHSAWQKRGKKIQLPPQNSLKRAGKFQLQGLLSSEELKKRDQSELVTSCKVFKENREGLRDPLSPQERMPTYWCPLLTGTVDE